MSQEQSELSNVLSRFFSAVDQRNWDRLKQIFSEEVVLDYSSYTGIPASNMNAVEIVAGWADGLAKFDATHHQIGTVEINVEDNSAQVFCHGTATHWKKGAPGGESQQIIGDYEFKFQLQRG